MTILFHHCGPSRTGMMIYIIISMRLHFQNITLAYLKLPSSSITSYHPIFHVLFFCMLFSIKRNKEKTHSANQCSEIGILKNTRNLSIKEKASNTSLYRTLSFEKNTKFSCFPGNQDNYEIEKALTA